MNTNGNTQLATRTEYTVLDSTLQEAQVTFLMQRTPKNEIKTRQGAGGRTFTYIEHGYVTELLNKVFGFNWDFEVVSHMILDDEVIVEARLTVRSPGGQVITKTQFGGADIERFNAAHQSKAGRPLSIADNLKAAASDALKKCASLLGVGLDVYGRDHYGDAPGQGAPDPRQPLRIQHDVIEGESTQVMTSTLPNGASDKQRNAIRAIARSKNLNADQWAHDQFQTVVDNLTKQQASTLIDKLNEAA